MRLLLVEDTVRLRELLTDAVHGAGWRIDAFGTIADAREAIATTAFDLVLVDLGMPDGDGIELVRDIRRNGIRAPILVLTARGTVDDRIVGLDAGADDYLVKPFNHREFLARCRALLRRAPVTVMPTLSAGRLVFDCATGLARCDEDDLALAPRERAVLEILLREFGRVVPKRRLEHALSEFDDEISSNAIEQSISRLRKKLESHPTETSLETIRGIGYLLREAAP